MKGITAFKEQRNNLELPVPTIDNMFCTWRAQPYDFHLKERFLYFLCLFVFLLSAFSRFILTFFGLSAFFPSAFNYPHFSISIRHPQVSGPRFTDTPLALNNWEQKYCQPLGKPFTRVLRGLFFSKGKFKLFNSLFHSMYLAFSKKFVFCCRFVCRAFLWVVCDEDKCCVVTQRAADVRVAWIVYVRTFCFPISTLNQNKRTRLIYLG